MAFFGDLTSLRRDGRLNADRVEAAKRACRGGHQIRDLANLAEYLDEKFPEGIGYFDSAMSEGEFPKSLAAFQVSVHGSWGKIEQHGIYVVFGSLLVKRVLEAKDAFASEGKFRDQLAGAKQHYANGLMHCVKVAKEQGLETLTFPPQVSEGEMSLLQAAQLAVQAQRMSASLRAEKYARPGGSASVVFAYKSSLENLSTACQILGSVDKENAVKNNRVADNLEAKARSLVLAADKGLLEACSKGQGITEEADAQIKQEKRVAASAARLVPPVAVAPPDACLRCASAAPTHWGYSCQHQVLCEECVSTGGDDLVECPQCGDYTEFVLAARKPAPLKHPLGS